MNFVLGPQWDQEILSSCYIHPGNVVGDLELEEVSGFVTCSITISAWWLGYVLETHTEAASTDILAFASPTRSFSFI
jgi:hypothetical protein